MERTTSNDAFVDSILFSLSLEDKVGEMTQLTLGAIGTGKPSELDEPQHLDSVKCARLSSITGLEAF